MVLFYKGRNNIFFFVGTKKLPEPGNLLKLQWLFGGADMIRQESLEGYFIGPRKEMITPWSTNAVEMTLNM